MESFTFTHSFMDHFIRVVLYFKIDIALGIFNMHLLDAEMYFEYIVVTIFFTPIFF